MLFLLNMVCESYYRCLVIVGGLAAVKKEMQQFHDLDVITPINVKILIKQQKSQALSCLIFLKEKRDGNIKGHGCADGQKQ